MTCFILCLQICTCGVQMRREQSLEPSPILPAVLFRATLLPPTAPLCVCMQVLYASKPQTAGGPFRSPLGRTVFPGQRATQSIQEPNICINEVGLSCTWRAV